GTAYKSCVENGVNIPQEDLDKHGINFSITHVDFMIGSADMNIVGEKANGEKVQIFQDGNWAF
ncbi:aminopeptidase, partial [Burkholderia pseudomallei]